MQLGNPITIVCPCCKVGQTVQPMIAATALNYGLQSIMPGDPYIICRYGACKHVITGNEFGDVTATSIKNPGEMRRALLNL